MVSRHLTVLVDAPNVRRSLWPNIPSDELVDLLRAWGDDHDAQTIAVFDGRAPDVSADEYVKVVATGRESADDWIVRRAAELAAAGKPYWLVTSDREVRGAAGPAAERVIGGGSFAGELRGLDRG